MHRFWNFCSAVCYWSNSTWKMYAAATYKLNLHIILLTAITKGSCKTMDILVNDQTASIKILRKPGTWYDIRHNCVFKNNNISPLQWTLNIKVKTFYKYHMNKSFRQLETLCR